MNMQLKALAMVAMAFALSVAPKANAECGNVPGPKPLASVLLQSWVGGSQFSAAPLLLFSDHHEDPIVGFWKVTFTANGNSDIPDGAVIDSALVVWHNDGTEIMNSGRPPQDGNFCMGVWERVRKSKYKLNHFALGNDPNGNPAGPSHILETVFLSHDGNSYTGTFTIEAYDTLGNLAAHITGVITATRITVHTPSVF